MAIKMKQKFALLLAASFVYATPVLAVDSDFYLLDRDGDEARNLTNPIIPSDMAIKDNGNVRVKFEFDQSNSLADKEACVVLDYVQILTNRDIPISYGENGDPIVSQWETVWERAEIRTSTGGDDVAPVDFDLLANMCDGVSTKSSYEDLYRAKGEEDKWKFQLIQGLQKLGGRTFNETTEYQDADLKVGIIYFPKSYPYEASVYTSTHVGTLEERFDRDDDWQIAFRAEMTLSLHDTIPFVEEPFDQQLTLLTPVAGFELPIAYTKTSEGYLGCYGIFAGTSFFCLPASDDLDASAHTISPESRVPYVALIMCPGSIIQPHVDMLDLINQGVDTPAEAHLPLPQLYAEENYEWCQNLEKIERSWTDLTPVAEEGWMVSINQQTGELECISNNGICLNSLSDGFTLQDIETNEDSLLLETTVITGTTPDCNYQNGFTAACPTDLLISEPTLIGVINAFQFSAFEDFNTLSFQNGSLELQAGEHITTQNRRLQMNHNGNLSLYRYVDGAYDGVLWKSETNTGSNYFARFQNDGNFVVYHSNGSALWSSRTPGNNAGATLKLQGNGDLVIYSNIGEPIWSTGTAE